MKLDIRVYFEDTDCGGIVYHSNYLKYCERARSEIFFLNNSIPYKDNIGFVVKTMEIDFISTAKLGDLLTVNTNLIRIKNASLEIYQEIKIKEQTIFKANIILACIDSNNGKPTKIPLWANEIFNKIPIKQKQEN